MTMPSRPMLSPPAYWFQATAEVCQDAWRRELGSAIRELQEAIRRVPPQTKDCPTFAVTLELCAVCGRLQMLYDGCGQSTN